MNKRTVFVSLAIVAGAVAILAWRAGVFDTAPPASLQVTVPQLTETARAGAALFDENCAACHGPNGSGSENGPPLIHKIYEPGHHADGAFHLAAKQGVRSHHWSFGDMPPVEGITDDEVSDIVVYVREVQRANGIN